MQCQAIKRDGHRCHRIIQDGKRCWQHKAQSPKSPKSLKSPKSPKVQGIIYSLPTCSFCIKAKKLLLKYRIPYQEIVVNQTIIRQLSKRTGMTTVPQIFINGKFIGGYTELSKLYK